MALIDEYKQAIQDVLDGRAKEAPRPSELPWTEDKAATMWAAAAAELIAEANGGDALPDTPGTDGTYALQNTVSSGTSTLSWASGGSSGGGVVVEMYYDNDLNRFVTDKTAEQIVQAASTGPVSMHYYSNGDALDMYFPVIIKTMGGSYELFFNSVAFGVDCLILDVDNDTHWVYPD